MTDRLYMETTQISAERTAAEITALLARAGAKQVAGDYDKGQITGLHWIMQVPGSGDMVFDMPARVLPVDKILRTRRRGSLSLADAERIRAQAERVAWRLLLRWVQAQVAMIQTGMVEAGEVFFPYAQTPGGQTVYEVFKARGLKELPAPPARAELAAGK